MVNTIHKPLQLLVCNRVDDFNADNGHNVVGAVDLKTLNGGCTCTDICGIIFNVFRPKCGHCLFSDNIPSSSQASALAFASRRPLIPAIDE